MHAKFTLQQLYARLKTLTATGSEFNAGHVDFYICWYNEKRIKISLGSLSPIEYRESLGLVA